jgi:hypothetical protein
MERERDDTLRKSLLAVPREYDAVRGLLAEYSQIPP